MDHPVKTALIQFESRLFETEYNRRKALELCGDAADKGADLIVLPELFPTGYHLEGGDGERITALSETEDGPTVTALRDFCAARKVYVSGCIACRRGDAKPNITAFLIGRDGNVAGFTDKHHLFGLEKEYFAAGHSYPVWETEFGKVGIMICYDANFPEPARILALGGAEIILCPAAWRVQDIRLFDCLLPVRALENVVWLCAVNRYGDDAGRYNPGHSMIVRPDGAVASVSGGEREEIVWGVLEPGETRRYREEIPYLRDLRMDQYLPYFEKAAGKREDSRVGS